MASGHTCQPSLVQAFSPWLAFDRTCPQVSPCVKSRQVFWLVFVNLRQSRATWEKGTSAEKLPLSDWLVDMSVGQLIEARGRIQSIEHGTSSRKVVLSYIRKQECRASQ